MKPIYGLSKDTSPIDQPPGSYPHAENILITKLNQAVANEPGFASVFTKADYLLVGAIPVRDEAYVLFYVHDTYNSDPAALSQIIYVDSKGNQTLVLSHADLAFTPDHPFKGVYYYDPDGDLIVAWTDNNNPPRILNITNTGFGSVTPDAKYIERMSLFPRASVPAVQGRVQSSDVGSIQNGAYVFYISYEVDATSSTNYLGGYGSYLVGAGKDYDGISSESIVLDIENLDVTYDHFRIYAIRMENETKTGHLLARKAVPSTGSLTFIWTGDALGTVPVEDILINNASYTTAKTLTVLNDRLHLANLTTDSFFDYQPYANAIQSQWTYQTGVSVVNSSETGKRSEHYGSWRGFMPGATYAFYIAFVLKDGTYSPAFHIPGRGSVDNSEFSNVGSTMLRKCDLNDYSGYTGSTTDPNYFDSHTYHYGTMSITRNETETYPDTSSWDIKNAGGGVIGTLRNANVRHHKFPSVQRIEESVGVSKWEDYYGIKFTNIALPLALRDKVNGYTIFYAARDFGNMDVVAYVPTLAWNFQDSPNWDENASYPTDPGCGLATPADCWEYLVVNTSTQVGMNISYDNCAGVPTIATLYPTQQLTVYALENSVTITQGTGTITPVGAYPDGDTLLGCDAATIESSLCRIYDPTLLSKKPDLSNVFMTPEWYLNTGWHNTTGDDLDSLEAWRSSVGDIYYVPTNVQDKNNKEREEVAQFKAGGILAGKLRGRAQYRYRGVPGLIGNEIMISALRQYIPNMYTSYTSQSLASTNFVGDLTSPSTSDPYITGSYALMYAQTPRIYGGDISIEEIKVKYMTKEDEGDLSIYDPNDEANSSFENYQGYNYFKDNEACRTVREFTYAAPSRLPVSKMYEDEGLKPTLNSKAISYYTGSYLNQYLLNPAYETINTFKPAFAYDSITADFTNQFPTRIARSSVQQSESSKLQWRTFRSQDYYEHVRNKGSIMNIEEHNNELLIHHEQSLFKTVGKEQLSGTATEIYLGTGDIFNFPPREVVDIPMGYAGTKHLFSAALTKAGYFFVDYEQRKVFLVGGTLGEVSANGMRNWFRDNIPFTLDAQLAALNLEGRFTLRDAPFHPNGIGFTTGYDELYNRILLLKSGWKFKAGAPLATNSEYLAGYVSGKIYFVDSIPCIAVAVPGDPENPEGSMELQPIDTRVETTYTTREEWTITYSPAIERWVSFHSYTSPFVFNTKNNVFSIKGDTLFKHNVGAPGVFYTSPAEPAIIDIAYNMSPSATKVFSSFNWITESVNSAGGSVKKDTFTEATIYNSYQLSARTTLAEFNNIRETEGTWHFNDFRDLNSGPGSDIVDENGNINYLLADVTKPWYSQRRFVDKFAVIRLEYSNVTGNTLYLYEASTGARASYR